MRAALLVMLVSALEFAASGCGSGGGGGDGGVIAPATCIGFEALSAPAPAVVVARQGADSICSTVVVELVLTGVTDVLTVDFDANFDPALFRYDGFSLSGSRLTAEDTPVNPVESVGSGTVSLGLTRLGTTGADFTTSGVVVQLLFSRRRGAGSDSLSFTNTRILDSDEPPMVKTGISWSGGTLTVQ